MLDNMKMPWQEAGDAKFIVIEYRCFFLYQIICLVLICHVLPHNEQSGKKRKKTAYFKYVTHTPTNFPKISTHLKGFLFVFIAVPQIAHHNCDSELKCISGIVLKYFLQLRKNSLEFWMTFKLLRFGPCFWRASFSFSSSSSPHLFIP